jgi:hypothetical protein
MRKLIVAVLAAIMVVAGDVVAQSGSDAVYAERSRRIGNAIFPFIPHIRSEGEAAVPSVFGSYLGGGLEFDTIMLESGLIDAVMRAGDSIAYVAMISGLQIVNLKDPSRPEKLGFAHISLGQEIGRASCRERV